MKRTPIVRKLKKCTECGEDQYIWARGKCMLCARKERPPKPIPRMSERKKQEIQTSKQYYRWAILENMKRNKGICRCDECDVVIRFSAGRNVCHVVSGGANKDLYLEPTNHLILGKGTVFDECNCGPVYDESGKKELMAVFPRHVQVREELNRKYYTT